MTVKPPSHCRSDHPEQARSSGRVPDLVRSAYVVAYDLPWSTLVGHFFDMSKNIEKRSRRPELEQRSRRCRVEIELIGRRSCRDLVWSGYRKVPKTNRRSFKYCPFIIQAYNTVNPYRTENEAFATCVQPDQNRVSRCLIWIHTVLIISTFLHMNLIRNIK